MSTEQGDVPAPMATRARAGKFARDGVLTAYEVAGESADTLLLVHGHPFNRTMWHGQVQVGLEAGWRVLLPDLRGYGESSVVPGTTTLDVFAVDLHALIAHLDVRKLVIGGLSMGGQIVMEFLRQVPNRASGVLLAATTPWPETDAGRFDRRMMAERLLREGMEPYAAEALPRMLSRASSARSPATVAHVAEMMRHTSPLGAAGALRGRAERPSYEATLANLRLPALVVAGSEDEFTTRLDAERMRDLCGAELLWLEGIGHMPNLERPAEFNSALACLLKRCSAA